MGRALWLEALGEHCCWEAPPWSPDAAAAASTAELWEQACRSRWGSVSAGAALWEKPAPGKCVKSEKKWMAMFRDASLGQPAPSCTQNMHKSTT